MSDEFVIKDGVLIKYTRKYRDAIITIPDNVTSIGKKAFYRCENLAGVTISEGVTSIEDSAFCACSRLKSITIPKTVKNIGKEVFAYCDELINVTIDAGQCISKDFFGEHMPPGLIQQIADLYPHMKDGALKYYVLRKAVWEQLPQKLRTEIFMTRPGKDLAEGMFGGFSPTYIGYCFCINAGEARLIGEEILNTLSERGSAKDINMVCSYLKMFGDKIPNSLLQRIYESLKDQKSGEKAVKIIESTPALAERCEVTIKVKDSLSLVGQKVFSYLLKEKNSIESEMTLLNNKYSLKQKDLPELRDKEGQKTEPFVLAWLLVSAREGRRELSEEETEIIEMLNHSSFMNALKSMADDNLGLPGVSGKMFLAYPICHYADDALISELSIIAPKWASKTSGKEAPPLFCFRDAVLYNDSPSAMLFAYRYGDLQKYAKLRGTEEHVLREMITTETGQDDSLNCNGDILKERRAGKATRFV